MGPRINNRQDGNRVTADIADTRTAGIRSGSNPDIEREKRTLEMLLRLGMEIGGPSRAPNNRQNDRKDWNG